MNNAEEMDNIVNLTDENGDVTSFEFLDLISYDGEEYAVLLPCLTDEDEEAGAVVILCKEDNNDGTESYVTVEDEALLMSIYHIFKTKWENEYDFV